MIQSFKTIESINEEFLSRPELVKGLVELFNQLLVVVAQSMDATQSMDAAESVDVAQSKEVAEETTKGFLLLLMSLQDNSGIFCIRKVVMEKSRATKTVD